MQDSTVVDLGDITVSDAPYRMDICHPVTGNILAGQWVDILSAESPKTRQKIIALQNRKLQQMRRGKGVVTAEEMEAEKLELLVSGTVGWSIMYKGEKIPFSPENARVVYSELSWLYQQVDEAMAQRSNFMKS